MNNKIQLALFYCAFPLVGERNEKEEKEAKHKMGVGFYHLFMICKCLIIIISDTCVMACSMYVTACMLIIDTIYFCVISTPLIYYFCAI